MITFNDFSQIVAKIEILRTSMFVKFKNVLRYNFFFHLVCTGSNAVKTTAVNAALFRALITCNYNHTLDIVMQLIVIGSSL